jgi:N-acetylneuraminic acid mutarotase
MNKKAFLAAIISSELLFLLVGGMLWPGGVGYCLDNRVYATANGVTTLARPTESNNSSVAQTADSWSQKAPMLFGTGFGYGSATVVNGRIYVVGGSDSGIVNTPDDYERLEVYDSNLDSWIEKAPLPVPLNQNFHALVAYQNKIYDLLTNEVYDITNDSWSAIAPNPQGRAGIHPVVVGGKIYAVGGVNTVVDFFLTRNNNFVYDPTNNSWSEMAPVPTSVASYVSAVVDGKIYIVGGRHADNWYRISSPDNYSSTNIVQVFDPETNSWSQGTPLPYYITDIDGCATVGVYAEKRIYVFGGGATQIYDPYNGIWINGSTMPSARRYFSVVNVKDKLYVLGGAYDNNTYSLANEEYTPKDYLVISEFSPLMLTLFLTIVTFAVVLTYFKKRKRS